MCICPQHVCAGGNTTSWPSRSSRTTVAWAVLGNIASARQVAKTAIRIGVRSSGWIVRQSLRITDERPERRQVTIECSGGAALDQDVAQRGGLDRAGDHRDTGRPRREATEQSVVCATADDVERVDPLVT